MNTISNHLAQHRICYAAVVLAVANDLIARLGNWTPHTFQDWLLLVLNGVAAGAAVIVAYQSKSSPQPQSQP